MILQLGLTLRWSEVNRDCCDSVAGKPNGCKDGVESAGSGRRDSGRGAGGRLTGSLVLGFGVESASKTLVGVIGLETCVNWRLESPGAPSTKDGL